MRQKNNIYINVWASLVAQMVKNLPALQETRVQFLGWEDPLEKEMATHSSVPAWSRQEYWKVLYSSITRMGNFVERGACSMQPQGVRRG